MFEQFTKAARACVVAAQAEARELDDHHIQTDHLLLGILQDRGPLLPSLGFDRAMTREITDRIRKRHHGPAFDEADSAALRLIGIDVDEVMRSVAENLPGRSPKIRDGHIPFDKETKRVLEGALHEALRLGHKYIGTEHLLLALLKTEHAEDLPIGYDRVRAVVTQAG